MQLHEVKDSGLLSSLLFPKNSGKTLFSNSAGTSQVLSESHRMRERADSCLPGLPPPPRHSDLLSVPPAAKLVPTSARCTRAAHFYLECSVTATPGQHSHVRSESVSFIHEPTCLFSVSTTEAESPQQELCAVHTGFPGACSGLSI